MTAVPRLTRSLRFRLTLSYVALFCVLLLFVGWVFRGNLQRQLEAESRALLDAQWNSVRGYLRIVNQKPVWTADTTDPQEAHVVEQLRYVHLLADANGNVLTDSPAYESIGIDPPSEIKRVLGLPEPEIRLRTSADGEPFLVKAGVMRDERRTPYFFAIGTSLNDSRRTVAEFTRSFFLYLPVLLALTSVAGWFLAGRAIEPVNSVAFAAQSVTGSNLAHKIPTRGAGDELDHLIDSFNHMTERLDKAFAQTKQFSTDVSHELRTPLTTIRGQLEVALFTADTKEQYQEAILTALEAVEHLSSIVRALLLLSQAESGQLGLNKAPLNLAEVARDIVDQFQISAEEKKVALHAIGESAVVVSADRTQTERLLANLLSNAIKYTPAGGEIVLSVALDPSGDARITVRDNGVGIPPENLPHIFDRFYRVRNPETNKIQGLGLGLSFVAWIVSAHGGSIDVESAPGKGTTFSIVLPGCRSRQDAGESAPARGEAARV